MIHYRVTGAADVQEFIRRAAEVVERDIESLARQSARVAAVELARATLPLGFSEPAALRARIREGIERLWVAEEDILAGNQSVWRAYHALVAKHGPRVAAGLTRYIQKADYPKGLEYLRKRRIPRRVDRRTHDLYRTGKQGRIPRNVEAVAVGLGSARQRLINAQVAKAGLAKAGWVAAGLSLGGRIRYRSAATGATGNKIPPFLRKLARRQLGHSSLAHRAGNKVTITLTNLVQHIHHATNPALNDGAIRTAQDHFVKAVNFAIRYQFAKLRREARTAARKAA